LRPQVPTPVGQIDFTADCSSSFARVFDTLDKKIQTDGAFDAPPS
jgi:hypothetical protein